MKSTEGYRLVLTNFACHQAAKKHLSVEQIKDAFTNPDAIVPNEQQPGQHFIVSKNVSILGEFKDDRFIGITFKEKK